MFECRIFDHVSGQNHIAVFVAFDRKAAEDYCRHTGQVLPRELVDKFHHSRNLYYTPV